MLRLERNQQQPFLLACSKTIESVAATHPNSEKLNALISLYKKVSALNFNGNEEINVQPETKVFNALLKNNEIERDVDLINFLFQFRYCLWLPEAERYALRDAMALKDLAEVLEDKEYLNSCLTSTEWFSGNFKKYLSDHKELTTVQAMQSFLETNTVEAMLTSEGVFRVVSATTEAFRADDYRMSVDTLKKEWKTEPRFVIPTILIATTIIYLDFTYDTQELDLVSFACDEKDVDDETFKKQNLLKKPFSSGRVLSLLKHSHDLCDIALGRASARVLFKRDEKGKEEATKNNSQAKFKKYGRYSYRKFQTTPRDTDQFRPDPIPVLETLYHFLSSPNDLSFDEFIKIYNKQNKNEMTSRHFLNDKGETFITFTCDDVKIPLKSMEKEQHYSMELTFQIKRNAEDKEYFELIQLWTDEGKLCDEWNDIVKLKSSFIAEMEAVTENAKRDVNDECYTSARNLLHDIKAHFPDLRKKINKVLSEVDELYQAPLATRKTKETLLQVLQDTTYMVLASDATNLQDKNKSCVQYASRMNEIQKLAKADRLYAAMSILLTTIALAGCVVAGIFTFGIGAVIAGGLFFSAIGVSATFNRAVSSHRLFKLHNTMNDLLPVNQRRKVC